MIGRQASRRLLPLAVLAAAVAAATAAPAQEVPEIPDTISPLRIETDLNGVNLVNGRTEIQLPVLSVPAAPNLRFSRLQNAAPHIKGSGTEVDAGGASYSVETGSGSEAFRCIGSCESVTGTGSVLGGGTFFTQAGSGARYNFTSLSYDTRYSDPNGSVLRYLSSILYPNGERIDYTYDKVLHDGAHYHRPTRISSNLGFHITVAYAGNTFGTNAWSTVTQAAIYRSGASPVLLRRFTYTGSTVTDWGNSATNVGDHRVYSCTGCVNQLGADVDTVAGSLRLPGETTDTLRSTALSTSNPSTDGEVIGTVTRDGMVWIYAYADLAYSALSRGQVYSSVTVTGPEGYRQVYRMRQIEQRNVIDSVRQQVTDIDDRTTDLDFDPAYRLTQIISPELNRVSVVYDGYGNVVSRTTTPKSGVGAVTETALYRDDCTTESTHVLCYRPTWHRDAMSRQTDFQYNANGQLTRRTDPADASGVRRTTYVTYETMVAGTSTLSRQGVVRVCGTGAACGTGAESRTEYDYWGSTFLPSVVRRISGGVTLTTTYAYDDSGRPLVVDGPRTDVDDTTHYRYDRFGRTTWEIGPPAGGLRLVQRHTYRDSDDRVVFTETGTIVDPGDTVLTVLSRVEYSYDSRRNPNIERTIAGSTVYGVIQRRFDDRNRVECEARRMNAGQFALSLLPDSACDRDATGSQGMDRITRFFYDRAGQLLREVRAWDTLEAQDYARYTYTENGQRASVTDANGNRADLRYDGFDRLSRWVFPSAANVGQVNEQDFESYLYDAAGNRTSLRKRDGLTITYQYDALNRMIGKTVPARTGLDPTHSRDVFYGYDALDLMTFARFDSPAGEGVTMNHDGFGRLTSSSINMNGTTRTISHLYDAAGNRTRVTYPGSVEFTYAYDAANRLTGLYEGADTSFWLGRFTYTPRGLPDVRTERYGSAVDHGYDAIGRLTGMAHSFAGGTGNVTLGFSYNPASQIATQTRSNDAYVSNSAYDVSRLYTVNGLNQYSRAGSTTFAYDDNGNLTRSGSTNYLYDVENRLVGASGGRTASLRYDPLGRLYEVTGASGTRRFLWDGDALVAEYQASGAVAARYVHGAGAGIDDPLIWQGGGDYRWLHADHQGSIIAIANDGGAAQWINGYDAWGIPNTPGNSGRFQYTGQIWLGDVGMYHYKGRMYSPTLGRFLQVDPVGYDDQINLYAYVGNDPVNHTDPTGQECNAEGTACWSNNPQGNASGVTVRRDPQVESVVRAHRGDFQRPARVNVMTGVKTEPRGVINRNSNGSLSVVRNNSSGRETSTGDEASVRISANTQAVVHGHLAAADGNRTVADTPGENAGWGDAQSLSLRNAVPTYTIAGDRIGVHIATNGQVSFQMVEGTMTAPEMEVIQRNLDDQQRALDAMRRPH